jgi:hypothetical protein
MNDQSPPCDLCGQHESSYEIIGRIDDSDIYQVEKRLCQECVDQLLAQQQQEEEA